LYYGDNLEVLKDSIADESVDLVYLDPPFNSAVSYNVLFKAPSLRRQHGGPEGLDRGRKRGPRLPRPALQLRRVLQRPLQGSFRRTVCRADRGLRRHVALDGCR